MAFFKKFKDDIGLDEEESREQNNDAELEKAKVKTKKEVKKQEENNWRNKNKKEEEWLESKGQLAADVYETENDFCIQAPIAGITQDNIDISVENNMLIIKGERAEPATSQTKKYYYKECYWGPFSRQTILPEDANIQRISASFKNGILTVKIPKKRAEKRKIVIEMS